MGVGKGGQGGAFAPPWLLVRTGKIVDLYAVSSSGPSTRKLYMGVGKGGRGGAFAPPWLLVSMGKLLTNLLAAALALVYPAYMGVGRGGQGGAFALPCLLESMANIAQ